MRMKDEDGEMEEGRSEEGQRGRRTRDEGTRTQRGGGTCSGTVYFAYQRVYAKQDRQHRPSIVLLFMLNTK